MGLTFPPNCLSKTQSASAIFSYQLTWFRKNAFAGARGSSTLSFLGPATPSAHLNIAGQEWDPDTLFLWLMHSKEMNKNLLPSGLILARHSREVYNPAKQLLHQLYKIVGPRSWFEFEFLFTACVTPFFSCSCCGPRESAAAQLPAQHHKISSVRWLQCHCITVSTDYFVVPFLHSVFPRQNTYWKTHVHAGRIVLHLSFVIQHCLATRVCASHLVWEI